VFDSVDNEKQLLVVLENYNKDCRIKACEIKVCRIGS
jgi:hypothetical protein